MQEPHEEEKVNLTIVKGLFAGRLSKRGCKNYAEEILAG